MLLMNLPSYIFSCGSSFCPDLANDAPIKPRKSGCDERAGIYTSLIREKVPLDTLDIREMKKIASNTIFSRETRRKRFGGVV